MPEFDTTDVLTIKSHLPRNLLTRGNKLGEGIHAWSLPAIKT